MNEHLVVVFMHACIKQQVYSRALAVYGVAGVQLLWYYYYSVKGRSGEFAVQWRSTVTDWFLTEKKEVVLSYYGST